MGSYLLLKHLHLTLVVISGLGFALRGFTKLVLDRPLNHPLARIGSHLLDTLLLITGLALWVLMPYSLASWFGLKMALVLIYIALGLAALKIENRNAAVMLYLAALITYLAIAAAAMTMVKS